VRRAPRAALLCLAALAGTATAAGAAAETAAEFVARANAELLDAGQEFARATWVQLTYITPDTDAIASRAYERYLAVNARLVNEARAFEGRPMAESDARAIELLKLGLAAPAPDDPAKRSELAELETRMTSTYGAGKWCPKGPDSCRNIDAISKTLATSRDWDELLAAWAGWHTISPPMRKDYERFV
jgi:peptidyl-dipeptidase A